MHFTIKSEEEKLFLGEIRPEKMMVVEVKILILKVLDEKAHPINS